jgi:hypothetical protein
MVSEVLVHHGGEDTEEHNRTHHGGQEEEREIQDGAKARYIPRYVPKPHLPMFLASPQTVPLARDLGFNT